MKSARIIALGDIHGCAQALAAITLALAPQRDDTLVVLGDFIDRGPETRDVIRQLIELGQRCSLVALAGNHEEMLLRARTDELELTAWLDYGGQATLDSYAAKHPSQLPVEHLRFIESCVDYYETAQHLFVHASYVPHLPLANQPLEVLRWESLWQRVPGPHCSQKIALVGHTAQHDGEIFDLGYLKCIDTFCHGGGWLTALEVATGEVWQADREGRLRVPASGNVAPAE